VDLPGHPNVTRIPARHLAPDNDLGDLLVTQDVGGLAADEIAAALDAGIVVAQRLVSERLIRSAALHLRGSTKIIDSTPNSAQPHRTPRQFPANSAILAFLGTKPEAGTSTKIR